MVTGMHTDAVQVQVGSKDESKSEEAEEKTMKPLNYGEDGGGKMPAKMGTMTASPPIAKTQARCHPKSHPPAAKTPVKAPKMTPKMTQRTRRPLKSHPPAAKTPAKAPKTTPR